MVRNCPVHRPLSRLEAESQVRHSFIPSLSLASAWTVSAPHGLGIHLHVRAARHSLLSAIRAAGLGTFLNWARLGLGHGEPPERRFWLKRAARDHCRRRRRLREGSDGRLGDIRAPGWSNICQGCYNVRPAYLRAITLVRAQLEVWEPCVEAGFIGDESCDQTKSNTTQRAQQRENCGNLYAIRMKFGHNLYKFRNE